jgi:hypothetical protein
MRQTGRRRERRGNRRASTSWSLYDPQSADLDTELRAVSCRSLYLPLLPGDDEEVVRPLVLLLLASCGARTGAIDFETADESSPPPPDFAWYRLDETSGTTAHDSSPNHYDITDLYGVAWEGGANFDGSTVCGRTIVSQSFRVAPVTMSVWITALSRGDEMSNSHALTPYPPNAFSGDSPGRGGFGVGLNVWTDGVPGGGLALETGAGAAIAFHTLGGYGAGTEYFVALVIGPAQANLYVNGALSGTVAANLPLGAAPAPLHLGCTNDDTNYNTKRFFRGRVRDARIYTRLLGTGEIAQLYAAGPA